MVIILMSFALQENIAGVIFMFVLYLAEVQVKKRLLGRSLSSSLQLERIEKELVHDRIRFKFGVLCE